MTLDSEHEQDSADRTAEIPGAGGADLRELEHAIERVLADNAQSWETLAALSHKINNPLTSLIGRVQLLRQRAGDDPYVSRAAEVIEESSMRVAEYLREMVAVVKQRRAELSDLATASGNVARRRGD
jgi:signal transduction histidine kinase